MIDAGLALRKAYTALLTGLAHQNSPVALHSLLAPAGSPTPYVILGPWQERKNNTKHKLGKAGEINLDIVTRFPTGIASTTIAAAIAEEIQTRLKPTVAAEVLNVEGYNSYKTIIETVQDVSTPTGTDTIIRKIITVSHELEPI